MSSLKTLLRAALVAQRRFTGSSAEKPYGKPTTYRHSIWQGTPPASVKPEEFWPAEAVKFAPRSGFCSKKAGRKILVGVGTPDWAGSVSALKTALAMSTDADEVVVFSAPKLIPDFQREAMLKEGLRTAALVKAVQEIAKDMKRPVPRIEMSPFVHQPKLEVLKKVYAEGADVVVLGNGRYPANSLGNIATYLALNAPCDVMLVKGGSHPVE